VNGASPPIATLTARGLRPAPADAVAELVSATRVVPYWKK
jgi:hypothetical protein